MQTRREAIAKLGTIATGSIVAGAGGLTAGPAAARSDELTDEQRLEACITELREILTRLNPNATTIHPHWYDSREDGSFRFGLQGDVSFQPFEGDGLYLISFDGDLVHALVQEEPVFYVTGEPAGWSWYNAILCRNGDWESEQRTKIVPNFVRKLPAPHGLWAALLGIGDGAST